jgi:hypothetical protein
MKWINWNILEYRLFKMEPLSIPFSAHNSLITARIIRNLVPNEHLIKAEKKPFIRIFIYFNGFSNFKFTGLDK